MEYIISCEGCKKSVTVANAEDPLCIEFMNEHIGHDIRVNGATYAEMKTAVEEFYHALTDELMTYLYGMLDRLEELFADVNSKDAI